MTAQLAPTLLSAVAVLLAALLPFWFSRRDRREAAEKAALIREAGADSAERLQLRSELRTRIVELETRVKALEKGQAECHEERDEYKQTMLRLTAENRQLLGINEQLNHTIKVLTEKA